MTKLNIINILFAVVVLFLLSCNPQQFRLNEHKMDVEEISCLKMCPLDSVEVYAANAFTIYSGGLVCMRRNWLGLTQFRADITTEITEGEGIKFAFRTIANDYRTYPNITFEYTTNGCKVLDQNNLVANVDSIKATIGQQSRIIIENYGKLYNIIVNCDTVYYGSTDLPAYEYVIVEPQKGSSGNLSGIVFSDMNSDIRDIKLGKSEISEY